MHIPDGFLDAKTWVSAYALSAGALGYSIKKSRELLDDRIIPKLGIMAAFIFAAQMVNFPIAGATSGHLLGAALAAIILGPFNACLIISSVLFIQCIAFQDGGLTALGGNILNMGVIGVLTAYLIYSLFKKLVPGNTGKNLAIFLAAWTSVVVAAFTATLEISFSNPELFPINIAVPAMVGIHMLIGIGEGLITVVVVNFLEKVGFVGKHSNLNTDMRGDS